MATGSSNPFEANDAILKELEREITCPICHDHFQEPKVLQCSHCYCKRCVEKLAQKIGADQPFFCPECRRGTLLPQNNANLLPNADHINIMMNLLAVLMGKEEVCEQCSLEVSCTAVAFCCRCKEFICDDCVKFHSRMKRFLDHEVYTISELKEGRAKEIFNSYQQIFHIVRCNVHDEPMKIYCCECKHPVCRLCFIIEHVDHKHEIKKVPKVALEASDATKQLPSLCMIHDEPMKFYCYDCKCLICGLCIHDSHRSHRCEVVKTAVPAVKQELTERLIPLKEIQTNLCDAKQAIKSTKSAIESQGASIATSIEQSFLEINDTLKQDKLEQLEKVSCLVKEKIDRLSIQEIEIDTALSTTHNLVGSVEQNITNATETELITIFTEMLDQIEEETKKHKQGKAANLEPVEEANIATLSLVYVEQIKKLCKNRNTGEKSSAYFGKEIGLPGVDVCGVTAIIITNSSLTWQWEVYGLKIYVDDNALPSGVEQCVVNINASLSGHYQFPEDEYLVSTIFWFQCQPQCRFAKPITVDIQHCACSHNFSKLKFVKAVCTQKQLPYAFKEVDENKYFTSFNSHSSFGVIQLDSFSAVGITQHGTEERNYLAYFLYKEEKLRLCFHLYFVVTWNTATHQKLIRSHFKDATKYTEQFVSFTDQDMYRAQIDFQISNLPDSWTSDCVNSHVIKKKDIDTSASRENCCSVPYSQFIVKHKYSGGTTINAPRPALECVLKLFGTEGPCTIKFDIISSQGIHGGHGSSGGKPELKELMRELRPICSKWEDIGIELDVDDGGLQSIKSNNPHDSSSCLREMLRKWLAQGHDLTWAAVARATEHVGDSDLAGKLRSKY